MIQFSFRKYNIHVYLQELCLGNRREIILSSECTVIFWDHGFRTKTVL